MATKSTKITKESVFVPLVLFVAIISKAMLMATV
jgi:hypothetical protein